MYIQLLICPIRVKAQGLSFFPFVQFNISALGYLYWYKTKDANKNSEDKGIK